MPKDYKLKDFERMLDLNGSNLSGGQRQRIAIAKSLTRKPKILLLDEATSALDERNQEEIIHNISKLASNLTVISITHRYSTIKQADKIFFLEKGTSV